MAATSSSAGLRQPLPYAGITRIRFKGSFCAGQNSQ